MWILRSLWFDESNWATFTPTFGSHWRARSRDLMTTVCAANGCLDGVVGVSAGFVTPETYIMQCGQMLGVKVAQILHLNVPTLPKSLTLLTISVQKLSQQFNLPNFGQNKSTADSHKGPIADRNWPNCEKSPNLVTLRYMVREGGERRADSNGAPKRMNGSVSKMHS